jgi:16S rRNA processing protein RimM
VFQRGLTVRLGGGERAIERVSTSAGKLRLKLSGIDDREAAGALRGEYILLNEAELGSPGEDRYYRFQLIGLRVVSTTGEDIGKITEVFSTASNDVFVVKGLRGDALIPAVDDVVQEIDLEAGTVTIEVIPGLLPDG